MRILIITRNAWDNTNSIGNTISNFFEGIEPLEFANVYFRESRPNNRLCHRYYRCTEFDLLKYWLTPSKMGRSFYVDDPSTIVPPTSAGHEKRIISLIHRYGVNIAYRISDALWYRKKWLNDNFRKFVEDFNPDIIFTFVKSAPQYYLTVRYIRETFQTPLFSWIADDEYTAMLKKRKTREIRNLQYVLQESAVICGCSQEICEYYGSVFSVKALPLYKACSFSTPIKSQVGHPIKIVYAGNLLYGRLDIIKRVSDILQKAEAEVSFDIYSNTELPPAERERCFGLNDRTEYKGRREYEVVKSELSKADVVLHVESFEEEEMLKTRYSFSTKIIDCLQSGSILLAIGPGGLSSIEYVKRIPGAVVIDDLEKVDEALLAFLRDTASFGARGASIREFAHRYHDKTDRAREMMALLHQVKGE